MSKTILENILFVIMMTPLFLGLYSGINRSPVIKNDTIHIYEAIEPWYIWEEQEEFGTAFKLARALLGSKEVFSWNGKEYTTLYKEEL